MPDALAPISKAIAGGVVAAIVACLARFGFHASAETLNAVNVVVTAIIGYAAGHAAVYFAPKNK